MLCDLYGTHMKSHTRWFAILAALLMATFAFAQEPASKPAAQEVVVRIQNDSAPAAKPTTVVQKANEWVEFGKNVGSAMDAGLSSLTRNANELALCGSFPQLSSGPISSFKTRPATPKTHERNLVGFLLTF